MKKITWLLSLIIALSAMPAFADGTDTAEDVQTVTEVTVGTETQDTEDAQEETEIQDGTEEDTENGKDKLKAEKPEKEKKSAKPEKEEKNKDKKPLLKDEKNTAKETLAAYKAERKAKRIETAEHIKNIKCIFKDADNETRKEILADIAAAKAELKNFTIDTFLNGNEVDYSKYDDVKPVIKDGRTIVPVRALTEALGAVVEYDDETRTITVTKDSTSVVMSLDSNTAYVNGNPVTIDVKPENSKGRALVPIRFIAEAFDLGVEWDGESQTIVIE